MLKYISSTIIILQAFTGNQEICLKIKEQQVEKIFELIAEDGSTGRSELLGLLKAITKVNEFLMLQTKNTAINFASVQVEELDLPLKRNQASIIKYFSITRSAFCDDLLGLEEEKHHRRWL